MKENIQVIERYFQALVSGDMDTLPSLFSESVEWYQPGNNPHSGVKTGFAEIGAMIGAMMAETQGTFVVKQHGSIMGNRELVSVPVMFEGVKNNQCISMSGVDIFLINDQKKIEKVWLFTDDQEKEDAWWSS